jgi:hypothetical protein
MAIAVTVSFHKRKYFSLRLDSQHQITRTYKNL